MTLNNALDARNEARKHLYDLRKFRDQNGLLDAAYDWLSMEIAQLESELVNS